MKKTLFLMATALAFVGCTSDEFMGETTAVESSAQGNAIVFSGAPGSMQRAIAGAEAAKKLEYNFNVLGTKKVGNSTYNVFAQTTATTVADADLYDVWYLDGSGLNASNLPTTTLSNTTGWEYVGVAGSKTVGDGTNNTTWELKKEQTIKYWDLAASEYRFLAYANTEDAEITNVSTSGYTVNGTPAQLAGLYTADLRKITSIDHQNAVQFTFRSAAAKVRLGIYETIPGYQVQNVKFYNSGTASISENAWVTGTFSGANGANGTATVVYDDVENDKADVKFTSASVNEFNFGSFTKNNISENNASPTWANNNSNYVTVLPNTVSPANMILKVDYQLYNATTGEIIQVTAAEAVVPATYMTWEPNHAYTYLFKISDNTNGYTGSDADKKGLYPITFDAVVDETIEAEQGTTTTVAAPSITTYQEGSVAADGHIVYKVNTEITVSVMNDTTAATLDADNLKVYATQKVNDKTPTEAELAKGLGKAATETTSGATFTLTTAGTYAIEYNNGTANFYKVIVVE